MIINPLPEYVDQEGNQQLIDIELDDELINDPKWLKKIKYRVGAIIVEFNYLEREIDSAILDVMNDRAEDPSVWVFLENMNSSNKIQALSKLYDIRFNYCSISTALKDKKNQLIVELDALRLRRNLYVHANWRNTLPGELVEHKTKRMKNGDYGRFRQKISINDLDKDLNRICAIQDEFFDLHEELLACI